MSNYPKYLVVFYYLVSTIVNSIYVILHLFNLHRGFYNLHKLHGMHDDYLLIKKRRDSLRVVGGGFSSVLKEEPSVFKSMVSAYKGSFNWTEDNKLFDWKPWLFVLCMRDFRDDCDGAATLTQYLAKLDGRTSELYVLTDNLGNTRTGHMVCVVYGKEDSSKCDDPEYMVSNMDICTLSNAPYTSSLATQMLNWSWHKKYNEALKWW